MKLSKFGVAVAAMSLSAAVFAGGTHGGGHDGGFGEAGKAEDVSRTIQVEMFDNYFEPEEIEVSQGETVRFVIQNNGSLVHEFNIGTPKMHEAHQKEMMMMVEHGVIQGGKLNEEMMNMDMGNGHTMKHDDPNSVLLEPGQKKEIVWTFSARTSMEFACNVPGHYQSGMYGDVNFDAGADAHASAH
ncbi:copper-binding protein [Marinobacter salinexigens]|uniref:Copper-binding protein n=1 Tax=Marinobacter salinexigens TaxID=2919747 RepID=A0A5B0VPL8_9GAMM|nr:cupredoxin domain-containing protein [Marinobacter salinexigens]KAA1175941.1 copper-binding protein [Marinobacter salinexigens]